MQKHNAMLTPLIWTPLILDPFNSALILLSDTHDEAKKEVEGGVHG